MSVLASLVGAYERLEKRGEVPPYGFSRAEIGFLIPLLDDGELAGPPIDLREAEGKKKRGRMMQVPSAFKRPGTTPRAFFLWDNTAFALGVTASEGKDGVTRLAAFKERHARELAGTEDVGLVAVRRFIQVWQPEDFIRFGWPEEMKDRNVVFALKSERRMPGGGIACIHDRIAAKKLVERIYGSGDNKEAVCLVTGQRGPISRIHPPISGILPPGGGKSADSLVSFNLDAFTSYGHDQGDNAPVSEAAAFAYTSALNRFLEKGSPNRIQIGDASTVFWADARDTETAAEAEDLFAQMLGETRVDEGSEAKKVEGILEAIREGRPLADVAPNLAEGVRFYVLGLAPNAARLSVRFFLEDDFGVLAENFRSYINDMRLEPRPANHRPVTIRRLLLRTAPALRDRSDKITFDADRISPLLAGELLRSVLTGARFPAGLLSLLVMRVRADHLLDSTRVALVKALVVRAMRIDGRLPDPVDGASKEDYLVTSQPSDPDPSRRLGRLFALIERAQSAALGEEVNSTVKDKFLSAAAATPQRTFPGLLKGVQAHLKRLRNGHSDATWIKDANHARRVGAALEREIGLLWAGFEDGVPVQNSSEEQGIFFVGYYQERYTPKGNIDVGTENIVKDEVHED